MTGLEGTEFAEGLVNFGKTKNEREKSSWCAEKNTDLKKKSHFKKSLYDANLDHNKKNLFGA